MLHVIAVVTTKSGRREEVLRLFKANMPAVHGEEGCLLYEPVVDSAGFGDPQAELGPDTFMVIERWASAEALRAHGTSPHMLAYAASTREMVLDVRVHVLSGA